jgi:O-antigen ligase
MLFRSPNPMPWRLRAVSLAAMLWGFVLFMPVGMNYLAAGLTLIAMAVAGDWRARAERFRGSALLWPLVALAAWVLLILLLRPHYEETGIALWHHFRIWITLVSTVLLSADEAKAAVRGFMAATLLALLAVLLQLAGLPDLGVLHHVTVMKGNKSINDALLFTLAGASAAVFGLAQFGPERWRWKPATLAFALTIVAGLLAAFALPSRTSLVGLVIAVLGACVHQWRGHLRALVVAVCVTGALAGGLIWATPSVQQKFTLGVEELNAARVGEVSEGSWVVRSIMYRETARMMLDRPLAGWGLGSWTPQWHSRGPALLANYNMPHDDFLWMGAEMGLPGLLVLLSIFLAGIAMAWRRRDLTGRMGFAAILLMSVATLVNSALRDAAIGLSLPWIVFVYLRLVQAEGQPWQVLLGRAGAGPVVAIPIVQPLRAGR